MSVDSMAILILLGSFFLMIMLRFPIAYAVALSSVFCLMSQGLPLTTICQQMVKGISSFSLMAVPFFITMGCLMGSGGISEKLIALANACVGWMRGGMAMVNIVASYFFGGISGSASADTASLGSILIPMMVDQGYDGDFSTAVTITSSCEGLLVPPSHNMVIYATTAGGISVGSLFLAGYVPGALLAVSLMVGSYIISVKRNYPKGDKFSIKNLLKQLSVSFWALAAVLIVAAAVGGIFIKNQMKSSDSTGKQTTSMNTVDKTPLQRQSDEVLDKLSYCKRVLDKKKQGKKKKEELDNLWNSVNEIHAKSYAATMTQEEVDEEMTALTSYSQTVDELYQQNQKAIEKLKKQDEKEESQKNAKK